MIYRTSARAQLVNNPRMKAILKAVGAGALLIVVFSLVTFRSTLRFESAPLVDKPLKDGQLAFDDEYTVIEPATSRHYTHTSGNQQDAPINDGDDESLEDYSKDSQNETPEKNAESSSALESPNTENSSQDVDEKDPKTRAKLVRECWKRSRRKQNPGFASGIPIQYIHVPKAGGTTIQESLIAWSRQRNFALYHHDGTHDTVWKCPGQIDKGVLMGHRGFGYCKRMQTLYGDRALYMVALREPVSRFRSLFDYFLETPYPDFAVYRKMWGGKNLSDLVVEADHILKQKLPVSDPQMAGPIRFLQLARQQTNFMCGWDCVSVHANITRPVVLERALKNLEKTDIVTIIEGLDDMIPQMRFHTALVPPEVKKYPMENIAKGKKSILTPEAAAIIAKWSKQDTILYEAAKKRYEELTYWAKLCLSDKKMASPPPRLKPGDDDDA